MDSKLGEVDGDVDDGSSEGVAEGICDGTSLGQSVGDAEGNTEGVVDGNPLGFRDAAEDGGDESSCQPGDVVELTLSGTSRSNVW